MPFRSATPCRYPSCRALAVNRGYCIEHGKEIKRQIDDRRGSPAERGYDTRWIKYRKLFLSRHPFCNGRFKDGSMCIYPATEVDHVQRVSGPDDPLFWDEDNHQALCKACHSRKTAGEVFVKEIQGKDKPVITVICGPPGSGKTTYARQHMSEGDLILDRDVLWQAMTGLPFYSRPAALFDCVKAAYNAVIYQVSHDTVRYRAWIIRGAPTATEREKLQKLLDAQVVVMECPAPVCVERIWQDERRKDKALMWVDIVNQWWRDYEPRDGEKTIRSIGMGGESNLEGLPI